MTQDNNTTKKRKFKQLNSIQRGQIYQMLKEKKYTQTQMAQTLGVSQSTISRELKKKQVL